MSDRDPRDVIKPRIRALKAYTLAPRTAPVKVNQNENPWDLPPALKEEVLERARAQPWSRYPAFIPADLCESLAGFAGWRADGILAGNGSNELIQVAFGCVVEAGVKVVLPEPTFTLYRQMVTVFGGDVIGVPMREDLSFDVDAMLAAAQAPDVKMIVVCSPNNPTGAGLDAVAVSRLLTAFDGLVVVDEAYHEFSGWSAVTLLPKHRNLVVLRTFSKAMGLAGVRFGCLLADPDLVTELDKARLPYNVGRLTQAAVQVAIEHYDDVLKPRIDRLVRFRDALTVRIGAIDGFDPVPTSANFFLVRSRWSPTDVCEAMYERGVLIRNVSAYPMLGEYFRVNVGTEDENEAVVSALTAIAQERT
ncbi:MAG: histidinol-phosphate transaminase [Proteobacteria bacterium]|nr:histidinol-phosphate transaminase [Pseudomonadota bacterium]